MVHIAVGFHKGRRTPGREQEPQRLPRRLLGGQQHGENILLVPRHGEGIVRAGLTGVIAQREVTAVHMGPAQGIAQALGAEVRRQHRLLGGVGKPAEAPPGRFGERAAKAVQGLAGQVGVNGQLMDGIRPMRRCFRLLPVVLGFKITGDDAHG